MRVGRLASVLSVGLALLPSLASSREGRPSAPPPHRGFVGTVRIVRGDEPIFTRPDGASPRRGAARINARLPVYAAASGPGCTGAWLQVGPSAWLCEEGTETTNEPPLRPADRLTPPVHGLPHDYFFVGELGSLGYTELETAELGVPDAELEPGFAIAVVRTAELSKGDPFGLTTHGFWVPLRDVRPANPSRFRGLSIEGTLDVAWTVTGRTRLHESPGGRPTGDPLPRQVALRVLERATAQGRGWLRVGPDQWVTERRVAQPRPTAPPPSVAPRERWIDVDLHEQVLTAYEGERPVFATLISSGKGEGDAENATPLGEHRIWVKLVSSDMDNLEDQEANRYYAMQSVPWVMYFEKGYGIHGAFWHADFGQRRSHGCVNLTPGDAARLFPWTGPRLPAGWSAVFPTKYDPGTLVRVRDSSTPSSN